ncbi:Sugar phosphate isomerase/epimerase [Lutibacter oricola]|uniref:Sugar phosphate isomerase/epimerase n=2 Tax=Lutibacter oricola TaxID=762486 RepID=A0A1H2VQA2_9FLAO|nr:Sugar phosphate isomerase/epimerase [Lutibacter oricola]
MLNAQQQGINQQQKLTQYIGTWYSADNIEDDFLGDSSKIKMVVTPKISINNALQVEVFEKRDNKWKTILVELISYDKKSNQIIANGTNEHNESFIGKGRFIGEDVLIMNDENLLLEAIMTVKFYFINSTEVVLKATNPKGKELWSVKYIKQNSKDKNIGVQLVSVKDLMNENPKETLKQLGRMGYSFIENFAYQEGKFYNRSPKSFKKLVEASGLKFKGSMVFKNFLDSSKKEVMSWWKQCIKDHAEAGVSYIITSSNELDKVNTLKDVELYVNYYNEIGKMCSDNGIEFGVHNHTKEFKKIGDNIIYNYWLENTNPNYVFFEADLYWMKKAKVNPIDYFTKYPGRFYSWHVKDEKELGLSGETNFEAIYKLAEKAGLKYNIAEIEIYDFLPIISAEMAYRYLYYNNFVKCYK